MLLIAHIYITGYIQRKGKLHASKTSCKLLMTTSVPWGSDYERLCPLQNPTLLLRGRYKYGGASTYSNKPGSRETCFHSWCHHTAHTASTPGATIRHILLPLLVPPYSTYCFHYWWHHTAHIASTPGATLQHICDPPCQNETLLARAHIDLWAKTLWHYGDTIQHILLPLLVPPYSTHCFHSWCHHTAHTASTLGATIQHILLPLLVPPYSTHCFHSWCHLTAHTASTPGATIQHILLPLLVPPYSTYCFHSWCHCGGPRYDQSRIRLNTYRACAHMHSDRFYLFWRALT